MRILMLIPFVFTPLIAQHSYHGVALAPDNQHGWVACIDTALIFHTTDGGASWFEQAPDSNARRFFDITCIDQFTAWTCGVLGEIEHTDNGGLDWIRQTEGLSKYATRLEFIDQNHGWVVCGDGAIGRTDNGGSYWEQIFIPWYSAELYGVSFLNQYDGWIVAGYPDSILPGQGLILKSTDGGVNWDSLLQVTGFEDFFDVHFFNLLDGIVIGGDESDTSALIWTTTSGGLTWTPVTPPVNTYYLRALDFVNDNNGWAVGRFGTIIHTTDGGASWTFQTNPATTTLFDVDFSDNDHGIACGQDIILYTFDGGQNWHGVGVEEHNVSTMQQTRVTTYPSPVRSEVLIAYSIEHIAQNVTIGIYDIAGCVVKSFRLTPDALRTARVTWDCTDHAGQPVPAGVYFVHIPLDGQKLISKVTVIK
ncbi:hypothetical protein JXB22_05575 [candidate division WOR-3 bacterium]|nr:hypothetical protein [candidate division WOR-3 bacterium]